MTTFRKVELGVDEEGNLKVSTSDGRRWRDFPEPVKLFHGSGEPIPPENTMFDINTDEEMTSGTFKLSFLSVTTVSLEGATATLGDIAEAMNIAYGSVIIRPEPETENDTLNDGTGHFYFIGSLAGSLVATPTVVEDSTDGVVITEDNQEGSAGTPDTINDGDVYIDDRGFIYMLSLVDWVFRWASGGPIYGIDLGSGTFGMSGTQGSLLFIQQPDGMAIQLQNGSLVIYGKLGGSTGPLFYVSTVDGGGLPHGAWGITKEGQEALHAVPEPDDGDITISTQLQWYDAESGSPITRFKQKDEAGVLTSGVKLGSTGSQDTVGSAGSASALPATPTKYIKVTDAEGNHYVIPAYPVS